MDHNEASAQDIGSALVWLEGVDGRRWPIGTNCAIGRSPTNAIVVDDRKVSRRHAIVHRQDVSEYWLVDLGSVNGSYVNGRRVTLPVRLKEDDTIMIGGAELTFKQSSSLEPKSDHSTLTSMTLIEVRGIQCWMLVADIVGSTKLANQYPSNEWASLVGSWARECRTIVERRGGEINKYLGDGFLAIWSQTNADVDQVAAAAKELRTLQDQTKLPFRIVMHKGEVASGGGQSLGEDSLSGLELIMLFRMEHLAKTLGTRFLVSEVVSQQLGDRLAWSDVGSHVVPGFVDETPRAFFAYA